MRDFYFVSKGPFTVLKLFGMFVFTLNRGHSLWLHVPGFYFSWHPVKAGWRGPCGAPVDGSVYTLSILGYDMTIDTRRWNWNMEIWAERWKDFKTSLIPWEVYYYYSSMDCDGVYSSGVYTAKNGLDYLRTRDDAIYWAEGPVNIYLTTEKHYLEHRPVWRDRGMEAFEDGHAHVVYY
jgi:hypothetical protein